MKTIVFKFFFLERFNEVIYGSYPSSGPSVIFQLLGNQTSSCLL